MKKHKKAVHAHRSRSSRPKTASTQRKASAVETNEGQEQKTDVSWQSEENREGSDALNVHENGPVANDVIGEEK